MNKLDYLRIALYGLLIALVLMLYQQWDKEHPQILIHPQATQTKSTSTTSYVPEVNTQSSTPVNVHPVTPTASQTVQVTTDLIQADIDTLGGNITQIKLLKYPESLHSKQPVVLLNNDEQTQYIAQSGLISSSGPDTSKGQATYKTENTQYVLSPDQKTLQVTLHWQNASGLKISKIFTFKKGEYEVDLSYQIENQSKETWQGNLYTELSRKNTPPHESQGFINLATYFGAAISSPDKPFEKISFKDMNEKNLDRTIQDGWVAMVQHYFVTSWVPDKTSTSQYFSRVNDNGLYTIGMVGPKITVPPGNTATTTAKLYSGPSIADNLKKVAPGLNLTVDYGWFWFISDIIFWMMKKIYDVVGNWGWSIVIVTLIIKLMFYQLSAKSYRSMSMLKKLQPKLEALKERYGDDKQKFTQATLELYKKEKVNPMSGCLPILVQIPVFIALYWVLVESVYLRQAPFILWIQDLSTKDPYYVLPILMGLSMLLQQKLSPPPPDPTQAKIMMLMPIVFTVLFLNFPAGLMLYWFVNNTLSVLQQWYIMRSIEKDKK